MNIDDTREAASSTPSAPTTTFGRASASACDEFMQNGKPNAAAASEYTTPCTAPSQDGDLRLPGLRVRGRTSDADSGATGIVAEECVLADQAAVPQQPEQLPSAAVLLELLEKVLLSHKSGPTASGGDALVAQVTKGLVLVAAKAVVKLFESSRAEIQQACGALDEREALAYLLGDVTGFGLISDLAARKAGDKTGKLVWVLKGQAPIEKELSDARRAVQKRAGKLPEGTLETELEDARSTVLRETVQLPLHLTAAECAAARREPKRRREEAPAASSSAAATEPQPAAARAARAAVRATAPPSDERSPSPVRFEGELVHHGYTCAKRRGRACDCYVLCLGLGPPPPVGWQRVPRDSAHFQAALARARQEYSAGNDICICTESNPRSHVPSFLCPGWRCYAHEAGACEPRDAYLRVDAANGPTYFDHCDCLWPINNPDLGSPRQAWDEVWSEMGVVRKMDKHGTHLRRDERRKCAHRLRIYHF